MSKSSSNSTGSPSTKGNTMGNPSQTASHLQQLKPVEKSFIGKGIDRRQETGIDQKS